MKIITPYVTNENQEMNLVEVKTKASGPREETLSLIRQFARIYTYEPRLRTEELGSFIMN